MVWLSEDSEGRQEWVMARILKHTLPQKTQNTTEGREPGAGWQESWEEYLEQDHLRRITKWHFSSKSWYAAAKFPKGNSEQIIPGDLSNQKRK